MKSNSISTKFIPRRATDLWRPKNNGEITILGIGGKLVNLNYSGFILWQLIDGERTIEEILRLYGSIFNQMGETYINDSIRVLEKMELNEIIIIDWKPL